MSEELQDVTITCVHNGPARIEGKFKLIHMDGTEEMREGRMSLCRCGLSDKMPLCDGNHKHQVPKHDDREPMNG